MIAIYLVIYCQSRCLPVMNMLKSRMVHLVEFICKPESCAESVILIGFGISDKGTKICPNRLKPSPLNHLNQRSNRLYLILVQRIIDDVTRLNYQT